MTARLVALAVRPFLLSIKLSLVDQKAGMEAFVVDSLLSVLRVPDHLQQIALLFIAVTNAFSGLALYPPDYYSYKTWYDRPHHTFCRNALLDEGRDCEFFTMMRNPIDRALSAFFYCPKDHDVQLKRPAKVTIC